MKSAFAGNMDLLIKLESSNINDLSNAFEIRRILADEYIDAIKSIAIDLLKKELNLLIM